MKLKMSVHRVWLALAVLVVVAIPAWGEPVVMHTHTLISECSGQCGNGDAPQPPQVP